VRHACAGAINAFPDITPIKKLHIISALAISIIISLVVPAWSHGVGITVRFWSFIREHSVGDGLRNDLAISAARNTELILHHVLQAPFFFICWIHHASFVIDIDDHILFNSLTRSGILQNTRHTSVDFAAFRQHLRLHDGAGMDLHEHGWTANEFVRRSLTNSTVALSL
jgi:hypothetical protein